VVDVDEVLRRREPHGHQRHQALASREHLPRLPQRGQHLDRLLDGAGAVVGERGRLHIGSFDGQERSP
jgi:hypothetical protein